MNEGLDLNEAKQSLLDVAMEQILKGFTSQNIPADKIEEFTLDRDNIEISGSVDRDRLPVDAMTAVVTLQTNYEAPFDRLPITFVRDMFNTNWRLTPESETLLEGLIARMALP